jgi:hypothetical protein
MEHVNPRLARVPALRQITLFDTQRALRTNLGEGVKAPHADLPLALAGLRNLV